MSTTTTNLEDLHRKIRGLLRKAEGTDNEVEAEVFYSKAQQLIMRYAIDEEKMWADDPGKRSKVEVITVVIAPRTQGAQEKRIILHACAKANRCRMWHDGNGNCSVAGYSSDALFVEMLYSSINTQMNFKMAIGLATNPQIHHKTYKNSFFVGYSGRIWDRFIEMTRKNVEVIKTEGLGQELVLADRMAQVNAWVAKHTNLTYGRKKQYSNINSTAMTQGVKAANETDISMGSHDLKGKRGIGPGT